MFLKTLKLINEILRASICHLWTLEVKRVKIPPKIDFLQFTHRPRTPYAPFFLLVTLFLPTHHLQQPLPHQPRATHKTDHSRQLSWDSRLPHAYQKTFSPLLRARVRDGCSSPSPRIQLQQPYGPRQVPGGAGDRRGKAWSFSLLLLPFRSAAKRGTANAGWPSGQMSGMRHSFVRLTGCRDATAETFATTPAARFTRVLTTIRGHKRHQSTKLCARGQQIMCVESAWRKP